MTISNQSPFAAPIAEQIWDAKYRLKDQHGDPIDMNVEDTWMRIAEALAAAEGITDRDFDMEFYDALEGFKFLPAGRITSGAGTGRNVTMSNCFTMGTIPDSMAGIFEALKEAALTMQQGGGIGYDFSTIRPKNSPVVGVASDASGPITFMDVWDAMCRTVVSAGERRGAMMATMRCDHPDIEEFVTVKREKGRLNMFNLSVLATDDFMRAVENDWEWNLIHVSPPAGRDPVVFDHEGETEKHGKNLPRYLHKTIRARELWDLIMTSTYERAEPGVIYIDRVNEDHNLRYLETIATTNPCGEKPMGPYASCLLGSINLARLVKNAFTANAGIDLDELKALVRTAIRMMDNVIDVQNFPLQAQRDRAENERQLGLGLTGLADALAMCGLRYGSEKAAERAREWMRLIDIEAYRTSVELAKEKGAFKTFDADQFLATGTHASRLPDDLQGDIREHGIRNALLTSIAPTGTISLYAGNVSSGVEPIFAYGFKRKVLQKDGSHREERVEDYAVSRYREFWESKNHGLHGFDDVPFDYDKHLPEQFVSAQTLSPEDHVRMQAALQPWVDSSISKTVNLPKDIDYEAFKNVYLMAYESGCKGCTTYRPNDTLGSVISVDEQEEAIEAANDAFGKDTFDEDAELNAIADARESDGTDPIFFPGTTVAAHGTDAPLPTRPETLDSKTTVIKMGAKHAVYVTVTDIEIDGQRRPYELFIVSKDPAHFEWTTALTRMVSAIFRRPHDASFVVDELKAVFSPAGGGHWRGAYQNSMVAAIGLVIEDRMKELGYGKFAPAEKDWTEPKVLELKMPELSDEDAARLREAVLANTSPSAKLFVPKTSATPGHAHQCPECFGRNSKVENGCRTCLECGHSACG